MKISFDPLLVVCIGNICRSPIGEYLFKAKLPEDFQVSSAGLGALVGQQADQKSIDIMAENGYDITPHIARQISDKIITDSNLILVMSKGQKAEIEKKVPAARGRVFRIGEWGNFDVPDPYRGTREDFEHAYELIVKGVDDWIPKILK